MLCLNDDDLSRMLEHQRALEWPVRVVSIVQEIERMAPHLLALEEVDRIDDLSGRLQPKLQLAAFKHRKTLPLDDGPALFYDPHVLSLVQGQGGAGPCVGAVRFSAGAELRGREGLALRTLSLPLRDDGVIGAESELEGQGQGQGQEGWGGSATFWAWTTDLKVNQQHAYDERVAVVALFEHKATGCPVLVGAHAAQASRSCPGHAR
jgi:hypothetical protein